MSSGTLVYISWTTLSCLVQLLLLSMDMVSTLNCRLLALPSCAGEIHAPASFFLLAASSLSVIALQTSVFQFPVCLEFYSLGSPKKHSACHIFQLSDDTAHALVILSIRLHTYQWFWKSWTLILISPMCYKDKWGIKTRLNQGFSAGSLVFSKHDFSESQECLDY